MTASMLKHLLPEYAAPTVQAHPFFQTPPPEPQVEPVTGREKSLFEKGYAQGFDAGSAFARQEAAVALDAAEAAASERLRQERAQWVAGEGVRLSAGFDAGLDALENRIADAVAHALSPFLEDEIRSACLRGLRERLTALWSDEEGPKLVISGPRDLLDAIRHLAAETARPVAFVENKTADIRVTAGDTVIETNLAGWVATIRDAVK